MSYCQHCLLENSGSQQREALERVGKFSWVICLMMKLTRHSRIEHLERVWSVVATFAAYSVVADSVTSLTMMGKVSEGFQKLHYEAVDHG